MTKRYQFVWVPRVLLSSNVFRARSITVSLGASRQRPLIAQRNFLPGALTHVMCRPSVEKLLNESGATDPQKIDFAGRGCVLQRRRRIKTYNPCTPAADIWFDDDRKSNLLCCGSSLDRAVHDTRARRSQSHGM